MKTDTEQRRKWREKRKKRFAKHPEKLKEYSQKAREKRKIQHINNPEALKKEEYKWRRENRDRWLELQRKSSKKRYHENPENRKFHNQLAKKNRDELKREVLSHYSPEMKCQRCGFSDIRALSLDHINGDGCKQKRVLGHHGVGYYYWLRRNNYPSGIQVLCMNCQFIKKHEKNENPRGRIFGKQI